MPKVSVIMSTYNEKTEYLSAAIESVLNQTFCDYEYLIVLDNPENTRIRQCVSCYAQKDSRIRILSNERNIGLTKSLNKAIREAKGIYMARMDADDIMAKDCLEKEVSLLEKEDLDLVSASKINIDESGKPLRTYINDFSPSQIRRLLPYDNHINHSTVLVKLKLIRRAGYYRLIPACEDYDLWIRLLIRGCRMQTMPDVMLYYRVRQDGIGTSNPYQQYISKRFVQKMYRQRRKSLWMQREPDAYEKYIAHIPIAPQKELRFNAAYQWFYRGMGAWKDHKYKQGCMYLRNAVCSDKEIIKFASQKVIHQIRKYVVSHCC